MLFFSELCVMLFLLKNSRANARKLGPVGILSMGGDAHDKCGIVRIAARRHQSCIDDLFWNEALSR